MPPSTRSRSSIALPLPPAALISVASTATVLGIGDADQHQFAPIRRIVPSSATADDFGWPSMRTARAHVSVGGDAVGILPAATITGSLRSLDPVTVLALPADRRAHAVLDRSDSLA